MQEASNLKAAAMHQLAVQKAAAEKDCTALKTSADKRLATLQVTASAAAVLLHRGTMQPAVVLIAYASDAVSMWTSAIPKLPGMKLRHCRPGLRGDLQVTSDQEISMTKAVAESQMAALKATSDKERESLAAALHREQESARITQKVGCCCCMETTRQSVLSDCVQAQLKHACTAQRLWCCR